MAEESILKEIALRICDEIRKENENKKFGFVKIQCWGCMKYAKGDPNRRCFNSHPGYRGCNLVNKRYDKENKR